MTDRSRTVIVTLGAVVMGVGVVLVGLSRPDVYRQQLGNAPITCRINPSTADRDTLCLLPGIAGGKARAIIENRRAHGPFLSPADLERVSGIGTKTRAGIEPWIEIAPGTD